jgi:hypothetical protein
LVHDKGTLFGLKPTEELKVSWWVYRHMYNGSTTIIRKW